MRIPPPIPTKKVDKPKKIETKEKTQEAKTEPKSAKK